MEKTAGRKIERPTRPLGDVNVIRQDISEGLGQMGTISECLLGVALFGHPLRTAPTCDDMGRAATRAAPTKIPSVSQKGHAHVFLLSSRREGRI